MKFSSTLLVATLAASAMAMPGRPGYGGGGHGGNGGGGNNNGGGNNGVGNGNNGNGNGQGNGGQASCGGNQVVSCCNNTGQRQRLGAGGLLSFFSAVLAPGACSPVGIPILSNVLSQFCGNNVAQCCTAQQTGLINFNIGQCIAFPF